MVGDILKIKNCIPPLVDNILIRPRITERLDTFLTTTEGFARQLTLISAPAGFGKTTIARAWIKGKEGNTAWLSLDNEDNDPERFWIYLLSALQNLSGNLGRGSLDMLQSGGVLSDSTTSFSQILTPLLNELFAIDNPSYLVIDDYHLINEPEIHKDLAFFIENLPPTLHVIVTTRSDPPWPLSSWRVKGKMAEVRMADLKFTEDETADFFKAKDSLKLNDQQLSTLYRKTEGWITGLQLAAFSLASSHNIDQFIESFAGSHRHVLLFLSEEVFNRQPETTKEFLAKTSILNRFSASLCDALTGRKDSTSMISSLEKDNLFLIPLDEDGTWFRYHPLFSDLLKHHLKQHYPDSLNGLHEKAGQWFLQAGEAGEAVNHLLTVKNFDEACLILHDHYGKILLAEGPGLLSRSLADIPLETLKHFPRLSAHMALLMLIKKGRDDALVYLKIAENLGYENEADHDEYMGILSAVKAFFSISSYDFTSAKKQALQAMDMLPVNNFYWRMNVAIYLGDAALFSGNPKTAYPYYLEAHRSNKRTGNRLLLLTTNFKIATSLYYGGKLEEADELTRSALKDSRLMGLSNIPRIGLLWTLLGEISREKGMLEEAERFIERGLLLSEPEKTCYGWNLIFKIALSFSKKDFEQAFETITEADILHQEVQLPLFITAAIERWKALTLVAQEKYDEASAILSSSGITKNSTVYGGHEWRYLVLTRILLKGNNPDYKDAAAILEQVEKLSKQGGYEKLLIETLIVKTLHAELAGSHDQAERILLSALVRGEKLGFFQIFCDSSKELKPVIKRIINNNQQSADQDYTSLNNYINKIIATSPMDITIAANARGPVAFDSSPATDTDFELIEDLTTRELEVLELIKDGLSNEAIAQKLFLSLGTVKWHTTNIYGKLGVRRRTEAVAQARKLKLIS